MLVEAASREPKPARTGKGFLRAGSKRYSNWFQGERDGAGK
jgi:hypothetical protein